MLANLQHIHTLQKLNTFMTKIQCHESLEKLVQQSVDMGVLMLTSNEINKA